MSDTAASTKAWARAHRVDSAADVWTLTALGVHIVAECPHCQPRLDTPTARPHRRCARPGGRP